MIVNNRHKFVFVHIPKTAGTSVSEALRGIPGESRRIVARTKHETPGEFLARVRADRPGLDAKFLDYVWICFVRDPWTRFSSLHRYLRQSHRGRYPLVPEDVNDFAALLRDPPGWTVSIRSLRPQCDYLPPAGVTSFIGRFETLDADFERLRDRLGIGTALPRLNTSGADRAPLSAESIALIGERYAEDVRTFGYAPPAVG